MVRLSMKAKKAAATIKRLLRAKRSQFSAERTKMVQSKISSNACCEHRVKGCRCEDLTKFASAEAEASIYASPIPSNRTASTYEDEDSTQQNGVDGLDHASRDFSFRLGHPHYINPGSRNPVRQLPKLDFLELARAQRNELQSESGVELKEGEEWALAPEEIGPARFPYELSYSDNYVAAPQVERRRSI
ncbi:hypothetical protein HDK90DRAFT_514568 [Phyllosticta capitalensis]|uniref:Uncharacterized protein n=1 Tax=Phyllosticta capitalensis TaxID=121624 RepID=A0ABR1YD86_9PEZI